MLHIVLHSSNKGDIHRSLKYCDFKTSKPPWKMSKYKINVLYILKETHLTVNRKAHSTAKSPFYAKDIPTFNELAI